MRYFKGITTKEDAHRRYRELAKKHHPDHGGSSETFQLVKLEYDEWNVLFKHGVFDRTRNAEPAKKRPAQKPVEASKAKKGSKSAPVATKTPTAPSGRQRRTVTPVEQVPNAPSHAHGPFTQSDIEMGIQVIKDARQLFTGLQKLSESISKLFSDDE